MRNSGFGIVAIVRRANEENWPAPGKVGTWHTSLVGRLLKNRALLGEYHPTKNVDCAAKAAERAGKPGPQKNPETGEYDHDRISYGDPVLDYYPRVLDDTVFLGAQAKQDRTGRFPGRRDSNCRNFLQGLLRCTCGSSFVRKNKQSQKQMGYARYYCTARHRGLSECTSVSSSELEGAVLFAVTDLAPEQFDGAALMAGLKQKASLLGLELSTAILKRDRYADAIGLDDSPVAVLLPLLNAAQSELEGVAKRLSSCRAEAAEIGGNSEHIFAKIAASIAEPESIDARAQLREDLGRLLDKCIVDADAGLVRVFVRGRERPIEVPLRPEVVVPLLVHTQMTEEEHAALNAAYDEELGRQ